MSHLVSRLLSVAITRQDDRELEYLLGYYAVVPESLWYWPPLTDAPPNNSELFAGGGGAGGVQSLQPMWDDRIRYGGSSNFPYRITGIVQDSGGNPVSNAVCSLFKTVDDVWQYDAVSKDGGQYDFGVRDTTTAYYIVVFGPGSTQGVTVNTLVGA